jgi:hypothetical protein
MHATKKDVFLDLIGNPTPHKDQLGGRAYVAAITALIPDFDLKEDGPLLDAFNKFIVLTLCVTEHVRLMEIREKAARHAAGKLGGFSLPTILPVHFRLCTKAFREFTLESFRFRCNTELRVSPGALCVLQTIFEALQDGVVTPITLEGRDKWRLDSPNGVACEIFVRDLDAVGMYDTDSAGEDDDTEDFQLDDQDVDDPSDEADEAVMIELEAQDEQDYMEADDETNQYEDFSNGDDSSDDE